MTATKESQTARILRLLKKNGKATNLQLRTIAWRYPARILDLKHEGHLIRSIHVKGPVWVYLYDGEVEQPKSELPK